MADEKTVKIRLLADSFNLYHYDEDGIPIKKRGFKSFHKGDTLTVPDFVADRLVGFSLPGPYFVRRAAVVANSDEDPYRDDEDGVIPELAPGVSQFPEGDFGSTTVGGELIADPDGELKEQRQEARVAEVTPVKKKPEGKAASSHPQPQSQHPAQGQQSSDKRN